MSLLQKFNAWCDKVSTPINCEPEEPKCEHTFEPTGHAYQDNFLAYPNKPKFFTISLCSKCGKPKRVYE